MGGDLATRIGQVGPRGAGLGRGRVGTAECGVGHALGFPQIRLQGRGWALIGTWLKEAAWGRVGPSRAG